MPGDHKSAKGKQPESPPQDGMFPPLRDDDAPQSTGNLLQEHRRAPSAFLLDLARFRGEKPNQIPETKGAQQSMPPLCGAPPTDLSLYHKWLSNKVRADGTVSTFQSLIEQAAIHAVLHTPTAGADEKNDTDQLAGALAGLTLQPNAPSSTGDVGDVGDVDTRTIFQMMRDDEALSEMGIVPDELSGPGAMKIVHEFVLRQPPEKCLAACKALVDEAIKMAKGKVQSPNWHQECPRNIPRDESKLKRRIFKSLMKVLIAVGEPADAVEHILRDRINYHVENFADPHHAIDIPLRPDFREQWIALFDVLIPPQARASERALLRAQAALPEDPETRPRADEAMLPGIFGNHPLPSGMEATEEEPQIDEEHRIDEPTTPTESVPAASVSEASTREHLPPNTDNGNDDESDDDESDDDESDGDESEWFAGSGFQDLLDMLSFVEVTIWTCDMELEGPDNTGFREQGLRLQLFRQECHI